MRQNANPRANARIFTAYFLVALSVVGKRRRTTRNWTLNCVRIYCREAECFVLFVVKCDYIVFSRKRVFELIMSVYHPQSRIWCRSQSFNKFSQTHGARSCHMLMITQMCAWEEDRKHKQYQSGYNFMHRSTHRLSAARSPNSASVMNI